MNQPKTHKRNSIIFGNLLFSSEPDKGRGRLDRSTEVVNLSKDVGEQFNCEMSIIFLRTNTGTPVVIERHEGRNYTCHRCQCQSHSDVTQSQEKIVFAENVQIVSVWSI